MTKKKSRAWLDCSEAQLSTHLQQWLSELSASGSGDSLSNAILFLEGEMGTGKSTFVRVLLSLLAPAAKTQGSPTFPLVTEYRANGGNPIYHIDLYRLKSAAELEDSGIEEQMDEPGSLVCVEWASLFADSFAHWFKPNVRKSVFVIKLSAGKTAGTRNYELSRFS